MAPMRERDLSASPQLSAQRGEQIVSAVDELPPLSWEAANVAATPVDAVAPSTEPGRSPADALPAFEVHYKMRKRMLGTGASGGVMEAECRRKRRRVAVKTYRKEKMTDKQLKHMRSELDIHSGLAHPCIVNLLGIYESETQVRIVMERLRGGELFDRVLDEGALPEWEVARVTMQLLQAVSYLHDQRIVHRDIKLENLVYNEARKERVKLIDFGFATKLDETKSLCQKCGTVGYAAPEVFSGQPYTEKVDMWFIGSVVYIMLTAKPLYGGDEPKMLKKNKAGLIDYCRTFQQLPKDAQLFVRQLLALDPDVRPTACEALGHPWLKRMAAEYGATEDETKVTGTEGIACGMAGGTENMEVVSNVQGKRAAACRALSAKDRPLRVPLGIMASC